jgi:hypothetical protein
MLASLLFAATGDAQPLELRAGTTIGRSAVVRAGTYRLVSDDETGRTAALTIRGDNVTIDFAGAVLEGTPPTVDPDQRKGAGVRVIGKNVTIKNLRVRGYKIGLIAVDSPGLRIIDSDFSYNWKQRLKSGLDREDLADWMSFHRNEKDEWLRYGAAIYLRRCDGFEVRGTRATGGQCGLMVMESNHGLVWNSDFSFLSAVGLGLYLSSDNRVMHNRFDWCVRGYSHGVYNRGQDSTGILIYEQSHRNIFAYNSATHGGDGFFLWAGQTTMDTGQGGCNDNLLYGNDWSHSPANGIESTFSRNRFVNNLLLENWHGIWGGYSFDNLVLGNTFGMNGESIAIEHGQDNRIAYNVFDRDHVGVYLWQNRRAPDPAWGYPKFRDTSNRGTTVVDNVFTNMTRAAIDLGDSVNLEIVGNRVAASKQAFLLTGNMRGVLIARNRVAGSAEALEAFGLVAEENAFDPAEAASPLPEAMARSGRADPALDPRPQDYLRRFVVGWNPWPGKGAILPGVVAEMLGPERAARAEREIREHAVAPLPGGMDPFLAAQSLRGRRYILVDEWGPYDFRRPILWPRGRSEGRQRFEVIGPPGTARPAMSENARLVATLDHRLRPVAGDSIPVPGFIDVEVTRPGQWRLDLTYIGAETADVRGTVTPAGKPVRFGWSEFQIPIAWEVQFFKWSQRMNADDARSAPREAELFSEPIGETRRLDRLDFASAGGFGEGLPANGFATRATGRFQIAPGDYVIDVTADDGVRVWLDGKPLIADGWKYQGPTLYSRTVKLGGAHTLLVEHFEIDGYAALKVGIRRP